MWCFPSDNLKTIVIDKCLSSFVIKNHVSRNRDNKSPKAFSVCEKPLVYVARSMILTCFLLNWPEIKQVTFGLRSPEASWCCQEQKLQVIIWLTVLKTIRLKGIALSTGHNVDFRSLLWCGWVSAHPLLPLRRQKTVYIKRL